MREEISHNDDDWFEIWKEDRQKWAPKPNEICKSSKKNEDQNIYHWII